MQILTTSGYINIEDANIGDELIAYEVGTGNSIVNTLLKKEEFSNDDNEYYQINSNWIFNQNQSIWIQRNNQISVVHVKDLQVGDIVFNDQDQDTEVTQIDNYVSEKWWRLEVSGDHSYIADAITLHNASRYWVGGGSSANWNATANTNWGSASGVQDNSSVPTSVDDVTFDGAGTAGNSNSIISATITIKSLNITTGYTSTLTHNAVLTIAGSWTMSNTHTIAGSSDITINGGGTINTNSQAWPNNISIISGFGAIITLTSNFVCNGTTSCTQQTVAINRTVSETWSTAGLTVTVSSNNALSGTAEIILTGGTWSGSGIVNNNLTINGNVTISGSIGYNTGTLKYTSGTVTTTGSTLNITGTCTLNANGITWNNVLCSLGAITLTSNFTCTGTTTIAANITINKSVLETWSTNGLTMSSGRLDGNGEVVLTGGTWTANTNIYFYASLTFNGNSTVSGIVYFGRGTLKYTSGIITTTGSTLTLFEACTVNTNGMTWNNVIAGIALTLTSNFTCTGSTTVNGNFDPNKSTSETWSTAGLLANTGRVAGTAEIILTGGTWSCGANIFVYNPLTFAGNVTVSGTVNYRRYSLKYTSGTITTTGSTLSVTGESIVFDTNGINWNNVIIGVNVTVNSLLNVTNTLTLSANTNIAFSGTSGWTCATLLNASTGGAATITLKDGNTYTINSLFNCYQSRISAVLFTSSHATNRAYLLMPNNGNNVCNVLASFTRIDASGGRTINTFGGTITNCVNINQYYDYRPVAI